MRLSNRHLFISLFAISLLVGLLFVGFSAEPTQAQENNPYDVDETQEEWILETDDRVGTVRVKNIEFGSKTFGPGQTNQMVFTIENNSERAFEPDLDAYIADAPAGSRIISPDDGDFTNQTTLDPGEQKSYRVLFQAGRHNETESQPFRLVIDEQTSDNQLLHQLAVTDYRGSSITASISPDGERQQVTTSVDRFKDSITADRPNYTTGIPPVDPENSVDTAVGELFNFENIRSTSSGVGAELSPINEQMRIGFEFNNVPSNRFYTVQMRYTITNPDYDAFAEVRFVRANGTEIDPDTTYYIGSNDDNEIFESERTRYFQLSKQEQEYVDSQGRIYAVVHHPEEKVDADGDSIPLNEREPLSLEDGQPTSDATGFESTSINIEMMDVLSSNNPVNFTSGQLNVNNMEITNRSGNPETDFNRGEQMRIHFEVENVGDSVLEDEFVYLLEDDRNIRQKSVNLNPGETQTVTFYVNRFITGTHEYSTIGYGDSITASIDGATLPPTARMNEVSGFADTVDTSSYVVEQPGTPFEVTASESTIPSGDGSYTWTLIDEDGNQQVIGTDENLTHTITESGRYTLQLGVNDNETTAPTSYTSTTIEVATYPPTAFAGDDITVSPGQDLSFDGGGSSHDIEGVSIVSYEWDFGDGSTASGETVQHAYQEEGEFTAQLTIADEYGNTATDTRTVTVEGEPPTARFSYEPDDFTPIADETELEFDASDSVDPDGNGISSYEWDFGDGTTATGEQVSHTFSEEGTYRVELEVETISGTDRAVSDIEVRGEPFEPVISGPDEVDAGSTRTYDSFSSNDPDNLVENITWEMDDGTVYEDGDDLDQVGHSWDEPGDYTVTLTMEGDGFEATDTKTVSVTSEPPVADAQFDTTINLNEYTNFLGQDSFHPNGFTISDYIWTIEGNNISEENVNDYRFSEPTINRPPSEGTEERVRDSYTPTLEVIDEFGASDTDNVEVDVINRGPIEPQPIYEGTELDDGDTVSIWVSDPLEVEGNDSHYEEPYESTTVFDWDMGDGTQISEAEEISYTYDDLGTFTVTHSVVDRHGVELDMQFDVEVDARNPNSNFSYTPNNPGSLEPVEFSENASHNEPIGNIIEYNWDFGDGNTSNQANPTHLYDQGGLYEVELTVVDQWGQTDTHTEFIDVEQERIRIPGTTEEDYIVLYDMEDGSGNTLTNRAADYPDGELVGSPYSWQTDTPSLEGTTSSIETTGDTRVDTGVEELHGDLTIDMWFQYQGGSGLHYQWNDQAGGSSGFRMFTNGIAGSGLRVRGIPGGSDLDYGGNIQTGGWRHIAIVLDDGSGTSRLYVDGNLVDQDSYSGPVDLNGLRVLGDGGNRNAAGGYDHYRFTTEAVDEDRIQQMSSED